MNKVTDQLPVGIEQAIVHLAEALERDHWNDGQTAFTFDYGKPNTATHYRGIECKDFFSHDGEQWGRRTEYEGGE